LPNFGFQAWSFEDGGNLALHDEAILVCARLFIMIAQPKLNRLKRFAVVLITLAAVQCPSWTSEAAAKKASPAVERQRALDKIKSWGYQLQKIDTDRLETSPHDLLVIDHAPDRVESVELLFRRAEIAVLKVKPDGRRRLVLAYVSIGEAERYRFYWDDMWLEPATRPSWLGPVNPSWIGNYPVEYWQPEWQALMFGRSDSYVDRVLEAGFDGIYLDRADVHEEFKSRPTARAEMARFITDLADHARSIKPNAIVVLQNAEDLMRRPDVRGKIDAVAKESLYFNADKSDEPTPPEDVKAATGDLAIAQRAGRKVLVVEYTADPGKREIARKKAAADGFLLHFAERTLSSMTDQSAQPISPGGQSIANEAVPVPVSP
jgi:cysteinyl-tRNA synthetase, unknown class